MTYVHVHWHAPVPIASVAESENAHSPGLYQICGNHPVYGPQALLYIGKSEDQTIAARVASDNWQLQDAEAAVRIGLIVPEENLTPSELKRRIGKAEQLLITAHKPSHNARDFKAARKASGESFHVLNWGTRGPLLPEVSEAFWSKRFYDWDYLAS